MPLMVCVTDPPRPSQKVFWCSFSLDPLRLQGVLAAIERLQHGQGRAYQLRRW